MVSGAQVVMFLNDWAQTGSPSVTGSISPPDIEGDMTMLEPATGPQA